MHKCPASKITSSNAHLKSDCNERILLVQQSTLSSFIIHHWKMLLVTYYNFYDYPAKKHPNMKENIASLYAGQYPL